MSPTKTQNQNFIPTLSNIYSAMGEEGLVQTFRRQKNLLDTLDTQSINELKSEFFNKLNIPNNTTKEQFIEIVKQETNKIFSK